MKCKICGNETTEIFCARILAKYDVAYLQCSDCGFIQTEEPHWLAESYQEAITSLDIGLVTRNMLFSKISSSLIRWFFDRERPFIDYAGGHGLFVRMMRDRGYRFFWQDEYCDNTFAKNFEFDRNEESSKVKAFEMLTAFEVFEHLVDPVAELEKMVKFSDSIFLSTRLQPAQTFTSAEDWWYFSPGIGQHVAFYSKESLERLADKFGMRLYTNGINLHLLTKKRFRLNPIRAVSSWHYAVSSLFGTHFRNKRSLMKSDMKLAENKLHHSD